MLELLLKLIDRIIDLKKYQAERIKKTFDENLEPLFNDLMAVHGDYIRMFEDVRSQVSVIPDQRSESGRQELMKVTEDLRRRRLEFEPVRVKLTALSLEMENSDVGRSPRWGCAEAEVFVLAVVRYFPRATFFGDGMSRSSRLVLLLEMTSQLTPAEFERCGSTLPKVLQLTIDECRRRWAAVCTSYAQLKMVVQSTQ